MGAREIEELRFPKFDYYLDESDPDIVILRRQDDSSVAAFSASGATKEGFLEAAKEDYGQLIAAYAARQQDKSSEGERSHPSAQPYSEFRSD